MSLSSNSQIQDCLDQYMNNLSYEGSIQKTQDFLAAVRALIVLYPLTQSINGKSYAFSAQSLEAERKRAEEHLQSINTSRTGFTRANPNHW